MKKNIIAFLGLMALSTVITFGKGINEKEATATANNLPDSLPTIESPAPQNTKPAKAPTYSPEQIAKMIGLELSSAKK